MIGILEAFGKFGLLLFNIAMLPLAIYAIMQLTGWDWVKAGVGALILTVVPLIGSLANLLFAMLGFYFVLQNWPNLF